MAGQQRGEAGMFLGDGGHAPIVRFPRAFGKNETALKFPVSAFCFVFLFSTFYFGI
jgi:hypothetical protein